MEIIIPIKPLSANCLWQGRKWKTSFYIQYEKDVSLFLSKQPQYKNWIEIYFKFYLKEYKRTDLDNLLKGLIDILVKNKILEDDRKIKKIIAEKFQGDDFIEIEIKSISS